jgi:hypothetical protein
MSSHTADHLGVAGRQASGVRDVVPRHYAIVEAPSILGLRSVGVDRLSGTPARGMGMGMGIGWIKPGFQKTCYATSPTAPQHSADEPGNTAQICALERR